PSNATLLSSNLPSCRSSNKRPPRAPCEEQGQSANVDKEDFSAEN
ncbi:4667_t:CDS:2, partial [Entrophospora sp. SA101]